MSSAAKSASATDAFIVARIQGGLGNQMFQFAAAQSLASRHQVPLFLDVDWLRLQKNSPKVTQQLTVGGQPNPKQVNPRPFELELFNTSFQIAEEHHLAPFRLPYSDTWTDQLRFLQVGKMRGKKRVYGEPHYYFDSKLSDQPRPLYMDGFWQSEKYFSDIRESLVEQFTPKNSPSIDNLAVLEQMQNCCSVSIHVRRGDFVSAPQAAAFHGTCSIEYYRRALDILRERSPEFRAFVFSDDMDWVTANLQLPANTVYVSHNRSDQAYWDLCLMSKCQHHIVANSSFSWWGAWLDDNPDKLVIAPPSWFATPREDEFDVVPYTWIRVQL